MSGQSVHDKRETVDSADLLFIRADRWPDSRSAMLALLEFDSAPGWDELFRVVEGATVAVPRLRQRVVVPHPPIAPAR